jgi:hypothetical protein
MPKTPLDTSVEAEYADGYIHSETEFDDVAQYGEGNVFTDILEKRPEADHGSMVRFSVFYENHRYDVDWTALPDNARPIRFRHGFSTWDQATGEVLASGFSGVDFGYQFNDEDGQNVQEVLKLGEKL